MKHLFICFILIFIGFSKNFAQDSVKARLILIGDAGEMNDQQKAVIYDAAQKIIKDKTTVLYLGNNVMGEGVSLTANGIDTLSQQILKSQYVLFRSLGVPVYFIPGNDDWDRMGPDGLAKVKAEWKFLNDQHDDKLKLLPADGCPDPVAIPVGDSMVVFAMDSEWWLFPFDKKNEDADCDCLSSRDITRQLRVMRYEYRGKVILLASHHPFESYGTYGGYFEWKDHLFPLTAINKRLFLPLPAVGSLYPLYRKTFSNTEDLHHPIYREMIKNVDQVFDGFPNLIHVSAHERGLQFIQNPVNKLVQIISGGGAATNHTFRGKYALYGKPVTGFVVADLLSGNDVKFTCYAYRDKHFIADFEHVVTYTPSQPITDTNKINGLQSDSLFIKAHPTYGRKGLVTKWLFGENYRKEWTASVKLPVIRISGIDGGLRPTELGGGYQSTSLRLKGKDGKEFALRTVEKSPDLVVPLPFQGTFVRELLDDATSAQHPYAALIVAHVADAVNIPHSKPVIGVVGADTGLSLYQSLFEGKVCLLEEREPLGKSDNTVKALKEMQQDHNNSYDGKSFLTARMIDLLFADWDRHADQWRFYNENKKGEDKFYIAVPRDRDMVLNTTQGLLPTLTKRLFVLPRVYGFKANVMKGSNFYMFKSSFLNAHPASQLSYETWMSLADKLKAEVTDSVLETALQQLPAEIYPMRHNELFAKLKHRRDGLPKAMAAYYRFSNQIVDVHTSNKNEFFLLEDDSAENGTRLTVLKLSDEGALTDTLVCKSYPYRLTRELRLFVGKGNDSIVVNTTTSRVKLRIIGGKGDKAYNIKNTRKSIQLYDREKEAYYGQVYRLHQHLRDDSLMTAFTPVNLYNTTLPLVTASLNPDDGLSIGTGFKYVQQEGFRKYPYASMQQVMVSHSFTTEAFSIKYGGEWLKAVGSADLMLAADIRAPDNTQNFFGRGNETPFDQDKSVSLYYRTRFDLLNFNASLRWRGLKGNSFSIGPMVEYYHLNPESNTSRFINNTDHIGSYDSTTTGSDRTHIGLAANYTFDHRDNKILPTWGTFVKIDLQGLVGANAASESFVRLLPQAAFYKNLNAKKTIILTDRIGGGVTLGKTAFYQSIFLGGQGNLMGYRQYRFAGQHALYNNLEVRIALSNFGNYLIKGQFGLVGFYDIGRVWERGEQSGKWHNGLGGGLYLSPASLAVFRVNLAFSEESFYPSFSMGFRF